MKEKLERYHHRRAMLYAGFVGHIDGIASSIYRAAHQGDTANILIDVERIKMLSAALQVDLDGVMAQTFDEAECKPIPHQEPAYLLEPRNPKERSL